MNRNKRSLQRMIIISQELFDELKPFINFTSSLNDLDREMYNILKDRKLNDVQKWYRYRQSLTALSEKSRKKQNLPIKEKTNSNEHDYNLMTVKPVHKNVSVQTKFLSKKDNSTEMTPKKDSEVNFMARTSPKERYLGSNEEYYYESGQNESDVDMNPDENNDHNNITRASLNSDYEQEKDDEEFDKTAGLIPDEEYDDLPSDIKREYTKAANEYIRTATNVKNVPDFIGLTGEDGTVYHISSDNIKKHVLSKTKSKIHKKKESSKTSKTRTREYLTRDAKSSQRLLNFPTRKFLSSPKLKWDPIK